MTDTDGDHVVVKHSLHGSTDTQSIEADTTLTIPSGDTVQRYMGFGVGEKAEFRFDDAGTDKPVAASIGLRYHYDAYGRVVGRTLDPGGTPVSQFFIYDNDRIVQELDGSGNLVAEWVYGQYIDEVLAMYRNTDGVPGFETYYYIQDDQYNVVALTDDEGTVVERYSYDDYGAPTVWIEDTGTPGTWIRRTGSSGAPEPSLDNLSFLKTHPAGVGAIDERGLMIGECTS